MSRHGPFRDPLDIFSKPSLNLSLHHGFFSHHIPSTYPFDPIFFSIKLSPSFDQNLSLGSPLPFSKPTPSSTQTPSLCAPSRINYLLWVIMQGTVRNTRLFIMGWFTLLFRMIGVGMVALVKTGWDGVLDGGGRG